MKHEVRLRDTRRTDWFWVQHVLIDVFQPVIGPLGVTVYNALCREVERNMQIVKFSMRELGDMASVSKDTAQRMLWKMQVLGMVRVRANRSRPSECDLLDLEEASGIDNRRATPAEREACIKRLRHKLAEAEAAGKPKAPAKSRHEIALEDPGLFDELPPEVAPHPVSERDRAEAEAMSHGETRCLKTGGVLSQKEGFLSHNPETPIFLLTEEEGRKETTLLNPPVGRTSGISDSEAQSKSVLASASWSPLDEVIAGLARLKPGIGDISDLREKAAAHMRANSFNVKLDERIGDRGDGRPGTIDLWCNRGPLEAVAIGCDAATPRERSLMKLARLHAAGSHTVLLLRTGGVVGSPVVEESGPHTLLYMGWPGAARRMAGQRGSAEQQARAAVGAVTGVPERTGAALAAPMDAESVRAVFARMRGEIAGMYHDVADEGWNPLAEWDEAFGSLVYQSHEARHVGAAETTLVLLRTPHVGRALAALATYGERIERAFAETFGHPVRFEVIAADST